MNFEVLGKFIVLSSDDSPGFRKELEAGKKIKSITRNRSRELPGGLVIRAPQFHYRGFGFNP